MKNENIPPPTSWSPEVRVFGERKFVGNALRFATATEAKANVHNLAMRWTLVEETRVVPTADPVTCRWIAMESRLEMLPVAERVPA